MLLFLLAFDMFIEEMPMREGCALRVSVWSVWVTCCSRCVHLHVKMFFVRQEIYHSLAARNLSQPSGERFPQMVCGEIFFGWLQRAPLGGALTRNLSIGELFGLSENGKSSQKSFPLEPPGRSSSWRSSHQEYLEPYLAILVGHFLARLDIFYPCIRTGIR